MLSTLQQGRETSSAITEGHGCRGRGGAGGQGEGETRLNILPSKVKKNSNYTAGLILNNIAGVCRQLSA